MLLCEIFKSDPKQIIQSKWIGNVFISVFGFGMNEKKNEIKIKIFNAIINGTIPIHYSPSSIPDAFACEEEEEEEEK